MNQALRIEHGPSVPDLAPQPTPRTDSTSPTVSLSTSPKPRPALKLVKTTGMSRQDWLAVRERGIGSSDAGAAVGLHPYKSQLALWMEKTGRGDALPQVDPNDDSHPMFWGTVLESIVASCYAKRTGFRVRRINAVLQHPSVPWMLANIDREVTGSREVQILECKTAGINGAYLWREGVPEYVHLQVMHQLAVTGKQAADVAVLLGGQELSIHRIERDDVMIEQLIELEQVFWNYVVSDTPPPADGSESADMALRRLYPRDNGTELDLSQDSTLNAAFSDLLAVRRVLERNNELEGQLRQKIQQRMGEASKAVFELGKVSWKRSKDSQVLDIIGMSELHPELVRQFTVPKSGSRRFLVTDGSRTQ